MDANGLQFWMISQQEQLTALLNVQWDKNSQTLKLLSARESAVYPADRLAAKALFNLPASTIDSIDFTNASTRSKGTWAYVNQQRNTIKVSGALNEANDFYFDEDIIIYDIAMGDDGFLYTIVQQTGQNREVRLINPHDVNDVIVLTLNEATTIDCIAVLPGGGAWLLDRTTGQLYKLIGQPTPDRPDTLYDAGVERPCEEFPHQYQLLKDEVRVITDAYTAVTLVANHRGQVAILLWPKNDQKNSQVLFINETGFSNPMTLLGAGAPFSMGYVKDNLWAVKFADYHEAVVYACPATVDHPSITVTADGDRYPLTVNSTELTNQAFCHSLTQPVHYPSMLKTKLSHQTMFTPRPLYSLSKPSLAQSGSAKVQQSFDSLQAGSFWHRMYLEANIPAGTGIRVWLCANEEDVEYAQENAFPHEFGYIPEKYALAMKEIPKGSFCHQQSELPHNKSLLACQHKPFEAGLFTVLIQRPNKTVRHIKGRYLQIKIELFGNGQTTPEVAAIRFYAPRFSYLDQYLPELYRESLFGDHAEATGEATGADFLQRFLCLFEGVLTPLEDKIANAHLLTNPTTAPAEALDWLGQWIGLSLEAGMSEKQKRNMLEQAMTLYRYRGTYKGLALALNLATDNMLTKGELVILEDFKLRRTFATILGADLSKEHDALMMNDIDSANSYIGDTFFLGDNTPQEKKTQTEMMALFGDKIFKTKLEQKRIDQFFSQLTNRVTILVHREKPEATFKMIRKIASLESPAHIEVRVFAASKPLIVGLYGLVGVDTYLRDKPQLKPAKVDGFYFGREGQIIHQPSLDDRLQ